MKVYKYIRYSTNKQDEASQNQIITEYCFRKGIVIDETYKDEGVSGGREYTQRNLGKLCSKLSDGDCVIVSEVSRITRNGIGELCEIVEKFFKVNKLRLIICNYGLDIDCSKIDPITEIQLYMMAVFAKIEKDSIRSRTQAALDSIKAEIDEFGYHISRNGNKITKLGNGQSPTEECRSASAAKKRKRALENENNVKFYKYFKTFVERNGKFEDNDRATNSKNWERLAYELNQLGYVTSSGLPFDSMRCRNTYRTICKTLGKF